MARIRTIKPEFWRNENLSAISPEAALLAIGLLNHSDDDGYFNANEKIIKADIFPLRELSCSTTVLLQELYNIGYIELYYDEENNCQSRIYGKVVNFSIHQVINKPNKSKIKCLQLIPYDYCTTTVVLPHGKGKEREREREREKILVESTDTVTFDDFYQAYPKKVKKEDALRSWKKLNGMDKQVIMDDIEKRKKLSMQWQDKKYIPAPSAYLNGKRWEDEIDEDKGGRGEPAFKQPTTRFIDI